MEVVGGSGCGGALALGRWTGVRMGDLIPAAFLAGLDASGSEEGRRELPGAGTEMATEAVALGNTGRLRLVTGGMQCAHSLQGVSVAR